MDKKKTYSNRRKTFHFSKKNDDLLQYLNQKDTSSISHYIVIMVLSLLILIKDIFQHINKISTIPHKIQHFT